MQHLLVLMVDPGSLSLLLSGAAAEEVDDCPADNGPAEELWDSPADDGRAEEAA